MYNKRGGFVAHAQKPVSEMIWHKILGYRSALRIIITTRNKSNGSVTVNYWPIKPFYFHNSHCCDVKVHARQEISFMKDPLAN